MQDSEKGRKGVECFYPGNNLIPNYEWDMLGPRFLGRMRPGFLSPIYTYVLVMGS